MEKGADEFSIRLAVPDTAFRLTPQERASIRAGFDVDALERLLAATIPELRRDVLESFQPAKPGELEPGEFMTPTTWLTDPELQRLLDEVWAPWWDHASDATLADETLKQPGREIARQRRAERRKQ